MYNNNRLCLLVVVRVSVFSGRGCEWPSDGTQHSHVSKLHSTRPSCTRCTFLFRNIVAAGHAVARFTKVRHCHKTCSLLALSRLRGARPCRVHALVHLAFHWAIHSWLDWYKRGVLLLLSDGAARFPGPNYFISALFSYAGFQISRRWIPPAMHV